MEKKYKSEILHMIHDEALANYEVGAITREELEEYGRSCFVPETPEIESAPASSTAGIPACAALEA